MGEKEEATPDGLVPRGDNKFLYKTWKLDRQTDGSWRCIRIRPTKWFTASSLNAAIKSIDRRESQNGAMSSLRDGNETSS